jgi:hypothetical protein
MALSEEPVSASGYEQRTIVCIAGMIPQPFSNPAAAFA